MPSRARSLREQIKDSEAEGANPAVLRKLNDTLLSATSKVTSAKGQAVLSAAPGQAQDEAQRQYDAANDLKDAARNIADLLAGRSKGKLSTAFAGGLNKDILSSLTPDKIGAIRRASLGSFDVKEKTGKVFGEQVVTNQGEVDKASQDFEQALKDLAPILADFGVRIEDITKDNLKDLAQELTQGILRFRKVAQDADKNKTPAGGLPHGSFVNAPNLDIFSHAGITGRTPSANRSQKAQSRFDFFNELSSNGGISKELLEGNSDFKQARAGVQNQNITDLIIKFLQGNNPNVGTLRDARGNANLTGIERTLGLVAGSGTQNSGLAKALVPLIPKLRATLSQEKVNSLNYSPDFDPSTSGLGPGVKYSTFAGSGKRSGGAASFYRDASSVVDNTQYYRANSNAYTDHTKYDLQQTPTAKAAAAAATSAQETPKQVEINVNIDGALNLIANGMDPQLATIINTKVNQAVIDATSEYFSSVQPQLTALNAQVAALNGKPLPPTPIVHNPMNAVRRIFKIPQETLPVVTSDGSDD